MKKFSFLTSVAVFGVMSAPAFADISNNAESATCNSDTIGVSSGSTILEALWTAQSKNCDAGQYLNASTANCTTCPTGSYCAGGTYTYNGSNLGITNACPTNYNSDEGASAQTDCYRACTTDDVAHSTAVSGRYYYGDNNQCTPTGCEKGYSVLSSVDFSLLDYSEMNRTASAAIYGYGTSSFYETVHNNSETRGQSYYGITTKGEWAADFENFGTVRGTGICSVTERDNFSVLSSIDNTEGLYCWCNVTEYRPNNISSWQNVNSSWVIIHYNGFGYFSSPSDCTNMCARECASVIGFSSDFKNNLLKTMASYPSACVINTYSCGSGTYLNNSTETCTTCPAGSYCTGGTFTYNGADQGITGACENGYTTDGSASAQSDCYRTCTTNDVAHSTSVSGKYYYGGNNQCSPTDCVAGYTPKAGLSLANIDTSNMNRTSSAALYGGGTGVFDEMTYGGASAQGQNYYGITTKGEWAVDFADFGTVRGTGICSTQYGTNNNTTWTDATMFANLTDETGENGAQYCYCNMTSYRANGSSSWASLSSSFVFAYNTSSCANNCASNCAYNIGNYAGFRSALFGTTSSPASCSANTITIDWYNLGTLLQTNSCTYGQSDIVIPETPSRTGYDFGGWKVNNAQ